MKMTFTLDTRISRTGNYPCIYFATGSDVLQGCPICLSDVNKRIRVTIEIEDEA